MSQSTHYVMIWRQWISRPSHWRTRFTLASDCDNDSEARRILELNHTVAMFAVDGGTNADAIGTVAEWLHRNRTSDMTVREITP